MQDSSTYLPYLTDGSRKDAADKRAAFEKGDMSNADARRMYTEITKLATAYLESHWFESFMGSDHYPYILELKAKEAMVPKLEQFQVQAPRSYPSSHL